MSPCATLEQLERFLRDGLHDHDLETVVDHLENCTACQQLLDQITLATEPERCLATKTDPESAEQDARLLDRLKAGGPQLGNVSFHDVISHAGDRADSPLEATDVRASGGTIGP